MDSRLWTAVNERHCTDGRLRAAIHGRLVIDGLPWTAVHWMRIDGRRRKEQVVAVHG